MQKLPIAFAALLCCGMLYAQSNPVPLMNQPTLPDAVAPGSPAFTLTVNGTGFVSGAKVNWNGQPRSTTYINSGQLRATIPSSDVALPTTAAVTVENPTPGGGRSNTVFFPVTESHPGAPAFVVSSVTIGDPVALNPVAIAVGDFNHDGISDLAVADFDGSFAGNFISVLIGVGDGTFQSHVEYMAGKGPISIITADFNNDGKLDLAVSDSNQNSISILLGNGDGTFRQHVNCPTGSFPAQVVAGDFNRDGKLDLAVVNVTDNTFSILLGNGNGSFQPHADYPLGLFPYYLAAGDFNGDGKLDLAVINRGDETITILLGKGDGTFSAQPAFATGSFTDAIATADFNGDGRLDLAFAISNTASSDNVSVMLGNGDGTFQPPVPYPTPNQPSWIATGDFNGDDKIDLAVASWNCPPSGGNCGIGQASIFLGNGDSTFQPRVDSGINADVPPFIAVADFNNDGQLDLVLPDGGSQTLSVLIAGFPAIAISPASLNFGTQLLGKTVTKSVTVTNPGTGTLQFGGITISSGDSVDYLQANTCGAALAAGASCEIRVSFTPHDISTRTSEVSVVDNTTSSPQMIPLTGVGTGIGLSASSLNFGTQKVGTTGPPQTVTVKNVGSSAVTVQSITLIGKNPADFSETNTCHHTIAAKGTCTVTVSFTPTAIGSRSAVVSISDDGGGSPQQVILAGTGN